MHTVKVIQARNVNDALLMGVYMFESGDNIERVMGRGGKATLEHCGPVATVFQRPCERVLFNSARNANPFFHFFETLWILSGRRDVPWLSYFLKRIAEFSDDGVHFHGAYGHRLRNAHDHDQLRWLITHLQEHPESRRAALSIFNAELDHGEGKDIPCNMMVKFSIRQGALNMTVLNRSNDMVWGAYGANVVQFSTLQELIAGCLGVHVGTYTQFSDSFHVYEDEPSWQRLLDNHAVDGRIRYCDPYSTDYVVIDEQRVHGNIKPYPMLIGAPHSPRAAFTAFDDSLHTFLYDTEIRMRDGGLITGIGPVLPYFVDVAAPLFNAFQCYKARSLDEAARWASECVAEDWRVAALLWLQRRGAA